MQKDKSKHRVRSQLDQWGRRKFHLQEASSQQQQVAEAVVQAGQGKSLLVGREESLNIEKYIGRIEKGKKNKKKQVFFCQVCNEGFKCDMAFITHLNSPQHNRKLGMSNKVKAATPEAVLKRLSALKKGYQQQGSPDQQENEITQLKEEPKQQISQKQQQNRVEEQASQQEDDLQAQLMAAGLPTSFGSKKVKR